MALTATQLQTRLDNLLAAEAKILKASSASIDGAQVNRAALKDVMDAIREVESRLDALGSPTSGMTGAIHVEFGDPA